MQIETNQQSGQVTELTWIPDYHKKAIDGALEYLERKEVSRTQAFYIYMLVFLACGFVSGCIVTFFFICN